jgi:hypothetical protein
MLFIHRLPAYVAGNWKVCNIYALVKLSCNSCGFVKILLIFIEEKVQSEKLSSLKFLESPYSVFIIKLDETLGSEFHYKW